MPPPVRRNPVPSLLQALMGDTQDPGYAEAAQRRRSGHERPVRRRALLAWMVVGVLVIGTLFGVAARVTEASAAGANTARVGLLADIDRAQARAGDLQAAAASLADQVRASQAALGAAGPLQEMSRLEVAGALTPVAGPGLRIVIDSSPDDPGGGVILDRDIQLLVNGLWSAGAEAIAIGGVRLQPTSAIRKAGGAILVDNKPVFWPLTIEAIGDPAVAARQLRRHHRVRPVQLVRLAVLDPVRHRGPGRSPPARRLRPGRAVRLGAADRHHRADPMIARPRRR